jgi:DNA (cytosine-5)-methyltransferase 1
MDRCWRLRIRLPFRSSHAIVGGMKADYLIDDRAAERDQSPSAPQTRDRITLREARLETGLGQKDLARLVNLSLSDLMMLERGLMPLTMSMATQLAHILGVEADELCAPQPIAGEGYVTATRDVGDGVIDRRREPDPALRPVIDLFCGVGGFSTGFETTGEFEVVAGVDLLGDRLQTFGTNHGAACTHGGDIRALDTDVLLDTAPSPFVVIGGPPCQGFSSIRPFRTVDWNDPRNNLGEEFCRIVAATRPEWLVFENVVGLVTHQGGKAFKALLAAFEALGYRVSARILNGAFHGLPQRRERLIIVGSRKGKAFDWPSATHHHGHRSMAGQSKLLIVPDNGLFKTTIPALTLMDAIDDLPPVSSGKSATDYIMPARTDYQQMLRFESDTLTMHEATTHSSAMLNIIKHAGDNINALPPGLVTSGFSTCYSRLAANEPANTITVNFVHPASNRCIHPYQDRALTPREGARLQSFPDRFIFRGSRSQIVKQIGNAVPPLLGRLIAEAILDAD